MHISSINNINFNGVWRYNNEKYTPNQNQIFSDIQETMYSTNTFGKNIIELLEKEKKGIAVQPSSNDSVLVHLVSEEDLPRITNINKIGKYSKVGQFRCSDIFVANNKNILLMIASVILAWTIGIYAGNLINNRHDSMQLESKSYVIGSNASDKN